MEEVSIIVPCYNCEKFIADTVNSVISQTYKNWELILVDDNSSDKTLGALRLFSSNYPEKIRVVNLKKNSGGPATPRNKGIEVARGKYLAFLDSDDVWHPRKLELQMKIMKERNSEFSCTQRVCFRGVPKVNPLDFGHLSGEDVNYFRLLKKNIISNSSVVVSKSLIGEKRFREDPEFVAVEDYAFWLKVLEEGEKCLKIALPLLYYRLEESSISNNKIKMLPKIRHVLRTQMRETSRAEIMGEFYFFTNLAYSALNVFKKKNEESI